MSPTEPNLHIVQPDNDAHFSDPANWVDVNADMGHQQPSPEHDDNEFDQVSAILANVYETPGDHGHMMLAVKADGHQVPLGQYLAGDLFKKMNEGKLTKEQGTQLYNQYIEQLKAYKGARIAKVALGNPMLTGAEKRVGWDSKELAAGENHQN